MRDDARRLIGAVAISAALHLSLIFGTAVTSTHHAPRRLSFDARLQVEAIDAMPSSWQSDPMSPSRQAGAIAVRDSGPNASHADAAGGAVGPTRIAREKAPAVRQTTPSHDRGVVNRSRSIVADAARQIGSRDTVEPDDAGQISSRDAVQSDDARALPQIDVPLLDEITWYTAQDLDGFPQPLVALQPRYPPEAIDVEGQVTVLLAIDASGRVVERMVVDARPPGVFEAVALAAFDDVAFSPAVREGRPVRSRTLVTLRFSPR